MSSRFPLPIGLCYADEGRIVLDPDQEVQGAVRLVFEVFRQTGSAYAVVHHFGRQQLRFPEARLRRGRGTADSSGVG